MRPHLFTHPAPTADHASARTEGLQQYVVLVAQAPNGGLRDKPGKSVDAYHTCYNLSGAASAQHKPHASRRLQRELANAFVSPFQATLIEEDGADDEVAVIRGEGESDDAAEERMRQVWSRSLAWAPVESAKIVYGDAANELVRPFVLFQARGGADEPVLRRSPRTPSSTDRKSVV